MGKQKHLAKKKRKQALRRLSHLEQRQAPASNTSNNLKPFMPIPIYYSDLKEPFPPKDEITRHFESLRKRPVFLILARFNMLLSMYSQSSKEMAEVQKYLMDVLIDDELYALIKERFANGNFNANPLFHRQQMLALMKRVLLEAAEVDGDNYDVPKEEAYLLGKLALIMSNLIHSEEQARKLTAEAGAEGNAIRDELCAQMLPTYELSNPPHIHFAFVRSYEYFKIFSRLSEAGRLLFRNGQSVPERFLSLTGLKLDEYLLLILAVHLWYVGLANDEGAPKNLIDNFGLLNFDIGNLLRKMKFTEEERRAFLRQTTTSIEGLVNSLRATHSADLLPEYVFTAFRTFPLIYTDEENRVVTCIDSSFMEEKISIGVYHAINRPLTERAREGDDTERRDQKSFLSFWGQVFEEYTNDRLKPLRSGRLKRVLTALEYERPPKQGHIEPFDAILDYGDTLVVFEHKGKYVDLGAKYSGKRELLFSNLTREDRIGKGITQLSENIGYVFSQHLTFTGRLGWGEQRFVFGEKDISRVKYIYPVIVHQDLPLRLNCVNIYMREAFAEQIEGLEGYDAAIQPLSVLFIEDLEILIPYLVAVPMPEVLDEYAQHDDPLTTFERILYPFLDKRKTKRRVNEWMETRFEQLRQELQGLFTDLTDD